jgi:hypothetical protein
MAKQSNQEKATELLSKMSLEELTDHYEETRKKIVQMVDAKTKEHQQGITNLQLIKSQVTEPEKKDDNTGTK